MHAAKIAGILALALLVTCVFMEPYRYAWRQMGSGATSFLRYDRYSGEMVICGYSGRPYYALNPGSPLDLQVIVFMGSIGAGLVLLVMWGRARRKVARSYESGCLRPL